MERTNNIGEIKDRAVFVLEKGSQDRNIIYHKNSYEFIQKLLNNLMTNSNLEAENIFIGGNKEDLILYLSGVIELYYIDSISIDLADEVYTIDPDFDVPNKID